MKDNYEGRRDEQSLDIVRKLWLTDRQRPSPRPLVEWIVEHEELHSHIVWWELTFRQGGVEAVMELAELETIVEQPLDWAILRDDEQPVDVDVPRVSSLRDVLAAAQSKPADVAKKLKVGTTVIARILRGEVDPLTAPVPFLVSFAQAVNTKVDTLLELMKAPQPRLQTAMYKRESRGLVDNVAEGETPSYEATSSAGGSNSAESGTSEKSELPAGASAVVLSFNEAIAMASDMSEVEKQKWLET